jgi:hypothetical protein
MSMRIFAGLGVALVVSGCQLSVGRPALEPHPNRIEGVITFMDVMDADLEDRTPDELTMFFGVEPHCLLSELNPDYVCDVNAPGFVVWANPELLGGEYMAFITDGRTWMGSHKDLPLGHRVAATKIELGR